MTKKPNSRANLDRAIERLFGNYEKSLETRSIMANAIVGQMLHRRDCRMGERIDREDCRIMNWRRESKSLYAINRHEERKARKLMREVSHGR